MCSRAERKRRRRARYAREADFYQNELPNGSRRIDAEEGAWIVYGGRGTGMSRTGMRAVASTRIAPILSLPFDPMPREQALGLAIATGTSVETVQAAARSIAASPGKEPSS
jgi:hypothetical protein